VAERDLTHPLVQRAKRSHGQARALIYDMVLYGNHYVNIAGWNKAMVQRWFEANGFSFSRLVEQMRDPTPGIAVPQFENMIGSTWSTGAGAKIGWHNWVTGQTENEVEGPAVLVTSSYWSAFEAACEARDRALASASVPALMEMVTHAVSSVDSYLAHRAALFNDAGGQPKLVDSATDKVPIDRKVREWVPVTSRGGKVDLGGQAWSDFVKLRDVRNDSAIHAKSTSAGWTIGEMAEMINRLRSVAQLLLELHRVHCERTPSVIIKAAYSPQVDGAGGA
jgi:hypothetical protein